MNLAAFKTTFWWEWAHRFLGRMICFAVLVLCLQLWVSGRIVAPLMPKLALMFVLGAVQGTLDW